MDRDYAHVPYRVPYADTDRMGVVYYANYLVYFERVRNAYLRMVDMPYAVLEARGYLLPVVEAKADYKRSAGFDELLDIYGRMSRYSATRLKFDCEVRSNERLLARGYTIHALVSRRTGKPVAIPPEILACCSS